jgi:hypothetical protein
MNGGWLTLNKVIATSVVALAVSVGAASAQMPGVYVLHSKPEGGFPALDWHVTVGPNHELSGVIGWDNMKSIARVSGQLNEQSRTFTMTATEVGGQGRTANIKGNLRLDGHMTANVTGAVTCPSVVIPYFVPTGGGGQ